MTSTAPPDTHSPPATLLEWRRADRAPGNTARHLWTPFESRFAEAGYDLFVTTGGPAPFDHTYGPKDPEEIRAPDPYHAWAEPRKTLTYSCWTNKLIPATRRGDGVQVMIHLVVKGNDGHNELEALRRLTRALPSDLSFCPILPILDEVAIDDMIFVVEPLVSDASMLYPWFNSVGEVLDMVEQVLRGFEFIHRCRIAHRDISFTDILHNYGASRASPLFRQARFNPGVAFRSLFDCRYHIIDFELADVFPIDTPTEECMTQGFVLEKVGMTPDKYGKERPPETLRPEPFNPFRADVYQLGHLFADYLLYLKVVLPDVYAIFEKMGDKDPAQRPTAGEALAAFREATADISDLEKGQPLKIADVFLMTNASHLRTEEEEAQVDAARKGVEELLRKRIEASSSASARMLRPDR